MLEELIKLRLVWAEEISSAIELDVPEKYVAKLLDMEKMLNQEIAALEVQAADIIRRYQI